MTPEEFEKSMAAVELEAAQDRAARAFMAEHQLLATYEKHEKTLNEFRHELSVMFVGNEHEAMLAARRVATLALEATWARIWMSKAMTFTLERMRIEFVRQSLEFAG